MNENSYILQRGIINDYNLINSKDWNNKIKKSKLFIWISKSFDRQVCKNVDCKLILEK